MVWAPCSGPTLAFAFGIASQSEHSYQAILIFFFFGLGAGMGLLLLGLILKKWGNLVGKFLSFQAVFNLISGFVMLGIGLLIVSGQMGELEQWLIERMPLWLIELSTAI